MSPPSRRSYMKKHDYDAMFRMARGPRGMITGPYGKYRKRKNIRVPILRKKIKSRWRNSYNRIAKSSSKKGYNYLPYDDSLYQSKPQQYLNHDYERPSSYSHMPNYPDYDSHYQDWENIPNNNHFENEQMSIMQYKAGHPSSRPSDGLLHKSPKYRNASSHKRISQDKIMTAKNLAVHQYNNTNLYHRKNTQNFQKSTQNFIRPPQNYQHNIQTYPGNIQNYPGSIQKYPQQYSNYDSRPNYHREKPKSNRKKSILKKSLGPKRQKKSVHREDDIHRILQLGNEQLYTDINSNTIYRDIPSSRMRERSSSRKSYNRSKSRSIDHRKPIWK